MSAKTETKKAPSGIGEFFRKLLVSLKRRPQIIPLLVMLVAFLIYSLNLSNVSNTTAKIQGQGMGLCGFATMLFSILSFVCFLNAFPKRKKTNIPMLVLMFVMFAIILFCDYTYQGAIANAVNRADNPIRIEPATAYIAYAFNMLNSHMIWLIVSAVLIALLPVYSKLLRRINTNISVEDNGSLGEIDISGED